MKVINLPPSKHPYLKTTSMNIKHMIPTIIIISFVIIRITSATFFTPLTTCTYTIRLSFLPTFINVRLF
jgi:hypothetical protein